jgi:molybdopterin-containing oxidoreductase family iron-sulfur binding subunit
MNGEKLWKIFQSARDGSELVQINTPRAGMSRRTFVELIGFSAAALMMSGCREPEQKIVPYVKQPVEFTPGVASWYASTCGGCSAACGILIKSRDGRPIKLEGNPDHPLTGGGLCPVAHTMVFNLYDSDRLREPLHGSKAANWDEVDQAITQQLTAIKRSGGKVRLLTNTLTSPTSQAVITKFLSQFSDGKQVVYEPVSHAAISEAHARTHKAAVIPAYHFERAKLIVSFSADFLGTWIAPVRFTRDYTRGRNLRDGSHKMSRHIQFESRMSLTGSNADQRFPVSPAEELEAMALLARLVAAKTGANAPADLAAFEPMRLTPYTRQAVERLADEISKHKGESLIVAGANDINVQSLVNFINQAAGNYGKTLDLNAAPTYPLASDAAMGELVREMNAGQVAAVIILGVNPAYDYFAADDFTGALAKVPLKISLNAGRDETTRFADFTCPRAHFLESWNDTETERGVFSLTQPAIAPLFQTRMWQESLLRWSGETQNFYDFLRNEWQTKLFPQQKKHATFDAFWDTSLRDGVFTIAQVESPQAAFISEGVNGVLAGIKASSESLAAGVSLSLYEKVSLRDGAFANNPWLQELPDPITKITWDNYACVSPRLAEKLHLQEGTVVRVTNGTHSVEVPAHIQVGQHDDCVAVALGYGRTQAGKAGNSVGANAYPFVAFNNGAFLYSASDIQIEKTVAAIEFAMTQRHDTLDGRPIVKSFTLAEYIAGHTDEEEPESRSIWRDHEYAEHKWAMVIDRNACTGCSACLLSCQAENNVPVVGRDEVRRQREMHWLRLDRYYEGEGNNLRVAYQPVMCSQCDNASCESVCPVLATVHSSEGLNMQVYNRCVGTRYCANNCAYKVRRFNWFNYPHEDAIANLALNPDVTVRTRGVMEKCTFCVQRIEEAKINARNAGRAIADGEIQTACQQSCPANAIVFGDLGDPNSRVNHLKHDARDYILLEELNLRPAISYLAKVQNTEEEKA